LIRIINAKSSEEKQFKFSCVLDRNSSQEDVFKKTEIPFLIHKLFEGYNTTIFAYGHTGAGKTYTMEGNLTELSEREINSTKSNIPFEEEGIISRSIRSIYQIINQNSNQNLKYNVLNKLGLLFLFTNL